METEIPKAGDIVVMESKEYSVTKQGSLYKLEGIDGKRITGLDGTYGGCFITSVRKATDREIRAWEQGVRNINDIPKEEIINQYEVF